MIARSIVGYVAWAAIATTAFAQHMQHASPAESSKPLATATAKPTTGPHGGMVRQVGSMRVETLVEPGGMRLFAFNRQGQPLDLRAARGLATLQVQGSAKRFRYDLFPETRKDGSAEAIAAVVDLSQLAGRQVSISYQLVGIPGAERRPTRLTTNTTVPLTAAQQVAAAIRAQKVCPVSGLPLGGMGKPIAVSVGGKSIYVCCASCINAIKENPAKYLAATRAHQVAPATEADAAAVALQKLCPVMDEPLDAMGGPYRTVVEGRVVYLCCPGCAKKLHANSSVYFEKLASRGVTPPPVQ